jgi:hypothetical protein
MRRILLAIVLSFIATTPSLAQQNSLQQTEIDALLVQLRSNDAGERDHAYERLKTDPSALRSPKVKAALLDLLDRETGRMEGTPRPSDSEDGVGTEGFAEYFNELASSVALFADWNDPRQACIMVRAGGVPPSISPAEAAMREKVAWGCLKKMSESVSVLDRCNASRIVMDLSGRAGEALDPPIARETKETVVHLLHDRDAGVRVEAIDSLEKFGTEDMIPALAQVAESDPAVAQTTHTYWLRARATKAIAAIQQRAGQH